jgi:hypothetical protein
VCDGIRVVGFSEKDEFQVADFQNGRNSFVEQQVAVWTGKARSFGSNSVPYEPKRLTVFLTIACRGGLSQVLPQNRSKEL